MGTMNNQPTQNMRVSYCALCRDDFEASSLQLALMEEEHKVRLISAITDRQIMLFF